MYNEYQEGVYKDLIACYQNHMTPAAIGALDSTAMLDYYSCYKGIMRASRLQNKKLYEEGFEI